jgi:hypothetical protein
VTEQPTSVAETGDTGAHGLDAQTGQTYGHQAHHGRPASWVAVSIIIIGFCVGGIALPIGPTWWLFWVGVAIVVIGGIMAMAAHILDDWY